MSEIFVFNHHSLPFESSEEAEKAIPEFLKICINASVSVSLKTIFVDSSVDINWFRLELSSAFFWQDWFDKNRKKNQFKEEVRAFRKIATHSPLFKAEDIGGDLELFDVHERSTGKNYSALRASAWYDSPLCSFPTRNPWNANPLEVCVENLDEKGDIVKNNTELSNIYNLANWNLLKNELIKKRNNSISSGRELWKKRNEYFSSLNFCGKSSSQLQCWNHGQTIFQQIRDVLSCLNLYAEKMKEGVINGYSHEQLRELCLNHEVSGESERVRQSPKLRKKRNFYLPVGNSAFFENHVKLSRGIRVHFFPEPSKGIINIGYIGPHLKLK